MKEKEGIDIRERKVAESWTEKERQKKKKQIGERKKKLRDGEKQIISMKEKE